MIFILLTSFFLKALAQEPIHWNYLLSVEDKHEFYESGKTIDRPKNSWQVLFSLGFLDRNFSYRKDCIMYKVPGDETGVLKIKTTDYDISCDQFLFKEGDIEIKDIKSLQFNLEGSSLEILYSQTNFKNGKLEAKLQSHFQRPEAKTHLSSTEFKSAKIIMLAPVKNLNTTPTKIPLLSDKEICHKIDEDCNEVSPSTCSQCAHGWYEIPNGCSKGTKVCGYKECGQKDGHACRRGLKWQRKDSDYDCRTDKSFAYCVKGLKVICEGKDAFCR